MKAQLPCFARSTSCIHRDRTNLYKTVLARSWWHCGQWQKRTCVCYKAAQNSPRESFTVDFNLSLFRQGLSIRHQVWVLDLQTPSEEVLISIKKNNLYNAIIIVRKCYLLKSCCVREKQGYQSGSQLCPGYGDGAPKVTCPNNQTIEEIGQ